MVGFHWTIVHRFYEYIKWYEAKFFLTMNLKDVLSFIVKHFLKNELTKSSIKVDFSHGVDTINN